VPPRVVTQTALLGNPFPANSVGKVPLDYLAASTEDKARILYANARGIMQQFISKQDFKLQHALKYVPFQELPLDYSSSLAIPSRFKEVDTLLAGAEYDDALARSDELISVALRGLRYIHG
jgi:phosphatidylinositol glycan class N